MQTRNDVNRDLLNRLRRIEGQIRGLHRMLEGGEACSAVITQLCAARNALDKVGVALLSNRIKECLKEGEVIEEKDNGSLEQALGLFVKLR